MNGADGWGYMLLVLVAVLPLVDLFDPQSRTVPPVHARYYDLLLHGSRLRSVRFKGCAQLAAVAAATVTAV